MKLIKQNLSLEIKNLSIEAHERTIKHSKLLPNSIRCIICGPSNCGKTNVMISLLLDRNGLKFKNIYLYSKTAFQPKYLFLKEVLKRVPGICFFTFNLKEEVIHPNEALKNSIMIFDDVTCENQTNIRNYFTMGRHRLVDCFYLTQTYSKVPKQLIRDNANVIIVFKQDDMNLRHVYYEHVNSDMEWCKFKRMCALTWKELYSFLLINKDCPLNDGRYRKGFDIFINLE